jgi:transposase-like protein
VWSRPAYLLGLDPADEQAGAVPGGHGALESQVSQMAKDSDAHVEEFRTRSLDEAGPFTVVAADALVLKVREGGRVIPVHAPVATGWDQRR